MNRRRPLVGLLSLVALLSVLAPSSFGSTWGLLSDAETSGENTLTAWTSRLWTQTSRSDFEAGVLYRVDTASSAGDVKLAISPDGVVRDDFDNTSKVASMTNVVVLGGVVQLASSGTTMLRTERPTANQTVQLAPFPAATPNWDAVNDVTSDGDATYVYGQTPGTYLTDLYRIGNMGNQGVISNVEVHFVARSTAATGTAYARAVISTPTGGSTFGPQIALTGTYTEYVHTFYYQPGTTTPWTIGSLNQASIGISLRSATGDQARCTQVWLEANYGSAAYLTPGTLTSTNLLAGMHNTSIDFFDYYVPLLPAGTSVRVRFSQDGTSWYSSTGVSGGWNVLAHGEHAIDLSALNWSGPHFYYQVELSTTDTSATPLLEYIRVRYSYYHPSGSLASQVYDTTIPGASWDALIWDETIPDGTDIRFAVRASDDPFLKDDSTPSWILVGSTSPVMTDLEDGRYKQWRATLTTTDPAKTPVLHEVRVYYDP